MINNKITHIIIIIIINLKAINLIPQKKKNIPNKKTEAFPSNILSF